MLGRVVAGALCAGLCLTAVATAARANLVTYSWEETSFTYMGTTVNASGSLLSFEVSGPLSVNANSNFAPQSNPTIAYQFPSDLVSFNVAIGGSFRLTETSFTNEESVGNGGGNIQGFPQWNLSLSADPAAQTASLALFFDSEDSAAIYGSGYGMPAQMTTGGLTTIYFSQDGMPDGPATYTGELVVTSDVVPEPGSAWLLLSGIGMLGIAAGFRHALMPTVA
jgi:hypothetical protein